MRRALPQARSQVVGLRYFNVYGPREEHKGRMASVAYHCYQQLRRDGRVELFGEHGGFPPGGHLRDFVAVEDVARVNLHFFDHPQRSGIFNLGSGQARTFNEVALAVINSVRANADQPPLSLQQAVESGLLGYREFPESLRARYQSHTCADRAAARGGLPRRFPEPGRGRRRLLPLAGAQRLRDPAQRPSAPPTGARAKRSSGSRVSSASTPRAAPTQSAPCRPNPPAMPRPPIQNRPSRRA